MTCKCGYKGTEFKMAFDVDEAYNYLMACGTVNTVRPVFGKVAVPRARVHLHRKEKFTGDIAEKRVLFTSDGQLSLKQAMEQTVLYSGFKSVDSWLSKLISLHGEHVTTSRWAIYEVELLESFHEIKNDSKAAESPLEAHS